jgi:hypothetical protein
MRLPSLPRALPRGLQRPAVLLIIGAGWLSILGNSPPPEYSKKEGARSGPVGIELTGVLDGCSFDARFSVGVRQVKLLRKSDGSLVGGILCSDGSDCITFLHFPPRSEQCWKPPAVKPTPRDATSAGADVDASSGTDASSWDALAGFIYAEDQDGGQATGGSAGANDPDPFLIDCTADGGAPVKRRLIHGTGTASDSSCNKDGAAFQIVVETAAGTQSTLDYELEVDEPNGYFGC